MQKLRKLVSVIAIPVLLISCISFAPSIAYAEETSPAEEQIERRTPMPYDKTFTTYTTARSAATLGFAYIYIKVDAVIDGQYSEPMFIKGAYTYQADVSRHFEKWEELSLDYSYDDDSIWAKATGYVYFYDQDSHLAEKQYIEIEHTWEV